MRAELARRTGLDVRLAQVGFSLPFGVRVDSVEVSKPGELLLKTRRLTATVNPLDLFSKTIHRLDVEEPILQLDIQELGNPRKKPPAKSLRYLNVQDACRLEKNGNRLRAIRSI
jgi:hypothetical protein